MAISSRMSEQVNRIRIVIRLRWAAILFIGIAACISYLSQPARLGVLFSIALVIASYNIVAYLHSLSLQQRKPFKWEKEIRVVLNLQIALDIVMVALAVSLTGGAYSALLAFFVVIIIAVGLVLSRLDTFLQATLALALLTVIMLFSVSGILPADAQLLPALPQSTLPKDFFLKIWIFQASFLYLGTYISGYIRSQWSSAYQVEQSARLQAETLRKMTGALSSTLELNQIIELVLKHLRELVYCDGAVLCLIKEDKITVAESWGTEDPPYVFKPGMSWHNFALVRSVVFERKPVFDWDAFFGKTTNGRPQIRSRVLLPLLIRDEVKGILKVHATQRTMLEEKDLTSIQALTGQIALAIENAGLYERTRQMAITDGLTGLYNRTCFYQELEREIYRSRRHGHKLSLLMCDLDRFKSYNDRYGHVAGDELLRNLAQVFTMVIRRSDKIFRYGGEEFALLLPETSAPAALELAERVRQYVEKYDFMLARQAQPTHVTISIGAATFPEQAYDLESLVESADKALFRAKEERNRVCAFTKEEVTF